MKKYILFAFTFTTIFIYGCEKDNLTSTNFQFSSENYMEITKEDFLKFDSNTAAKIWKLKLKDILKTNIREHHKSKILQLISILEDENEIFNKENLKLTEIALELAETINGTDFIEMFNTMNKYRPSKEYFNKNDIQVCDYCILDLKTQIKTQKNTEINTSTKSLQKARASCNCRWTCRNSYDGPPRGVSSGGGTTGQACCTHSNCRNTIRGCGFLWAFSCERRDEIDCSSCNHR
jgi:hypothetical protein